MPFNKESDELDIQSVRGLNGNTWKLRESIYYFHPKYDIQVCAPINMMFDLASIPAGFRWLVSNDDYRIRRPAAIHDAIYFKNGVMAGFYHNSKRYPPLIISREQADEIFYTALRESGVGWLKSRMMWIAVRIGGFIAWDND